MLQELNRLDPDELEQDSAQYLNHLYNIGSGGAIVKGTENEINQAEFDRLISCYMLASDPAHPYPYWQANALQSISEHLRKGEVSDFPHPQQPACLPVSQHRADAKQSAGRHFAQRALNLFSGYGRCLSDCRSQPYAG